MCLYRRFPRFAHRSQEKRTFEQNPRCSADDPEYYLNMSTTHINGGDENAVREAAYFLWLDNGCPCGRDLEFWTSAEKKLLEAKPVPGSTASELMETASYFRAKEPGFGSKPGTTKKRREVNVTRRPNQAA
jgi:Protein of unknown function (DUF2934)